MAIAQAADVPASLDDWIADPAVRTRHRRAARVSADELWDAAKAIRLDETRMLGRLVRWRIPGLPSDLTFHGLLGAYPFCLLDEGEHYSISGLCGRIWTLQRDYPRIESPEEFAAWDRPDSVRVLLGHWIEERADGSSVLVHEARVEPLDRRSRLRVKAVWAMVGRFEGLVGAEAISAAVRRAERGR